MGAGRRVAVAVTLTAAALVLALTSQARSEVERPHSFGFKAGYHIYPNSDYFVATQDNFIGGTQDFQGQSLELFDYTYQWPSRWSLNILVLGGYYQEFVPTLSSQHALFVHSMTVSPLYRIVGSDAIGAWQVYGGIGLGRYGLTARFDFPQGDSLEIHTFTLGYQAMLGAEYRYNEYMGFVVEEKFSRARIDFGDELGSLKIDVGGHNILAGIRIHF